MAFGKPPLVVKKGEFYDIEFYEAEKLRCEMLGGEPTPCGCVVTSRTSWRPKIIRRCPKHAGDDNEEGDVILDRFDSRRLRRG